MISRKGNFQLKRTYVGLATALVVAGILLADSYIEQGWLVGGCVVVLLVLGAIELQSLMGGEAGWLARLMGVLGVACVALSVLFFRDERSELVLVAFAGLSLLCALKGSVSTAIRSSAFPLLTIVYLGFMGSFLIRLRFIGTRFLLLVIACAKIGDSSAYYAGKYLGRNKLAPIRSPNKTVEGALGGFIGSVISALILWGFFPERSQGFLPALVLGASIGVASQLGDLVESSFKRSAGKKDSATLLPFLGGVLDILDCLLLSAPVTYCLIRVLDISP